jgi:hypothetical protein
MIGVPARCAGNRPGSRLLVMPVTQTLLSDEDRTPQQGSTKPPLIGPTLTDAQRTVVALLHDRFCLN